MTSLSARMQRLAPRDARRPDSTLSILPSNIAARLSPPLAERLARLQPARLRLRTNSTRPSDVEMAARLAGRVIAPGLIQIEQRLPLPWRHGVDWLRPLPIVDSLAQERFRLAPSIAPVDFLLLDTETSGLSGGTGTVAFTIGVLQVSVTQLNIVQFILLRPGAESLMLDAVSVIARQTKQLVTYNGKSFDMPLLRTRYRLAGMEDPFASHNHLDLLHWARRVRPIDWPDVRLATIESRLFGLVRPNDLPGHAVPAAWQEWLRHGIDRDVLRVPAHNRLDLLSLYGLLRRALDQPAAASLAPHHRDGFDLFSPPPRPLDPRARLDAIHALLCPRGAGTQTKLV